MFCCKFLSYKNGHNYVGRFQDPGSGSATMRCIPPYLGGKRMPQCQTGRHLVHDPPRHNKIYHSHVTWPSIEPVLGTCTTFSATAWRELKKVAHVAVALKQKIMAWWQWHEDKMALICAIYAPYSNQILHGNLDKLLLF